MKRWILVLIVGGLGIFWWWSLRQTGSPASVIPSDADTAALSEPVNSSNPVARSTVEPAAILAPPPQPSAVPSLGFREWMEKESLDLDRLDIDAEEKRVQLKKRMAEISPQHVSELLETIKNPKSAAREKILSTYLLVEGGARTEAELTELIIAPLQENPNFAPHSEEEMKGIREKSLRIMAIDGLFSRAQVDSGAKAALARAANEAADPSIRAYASDKLRQLR